MKHQSEQQKIKFRKHLNADALFNRLHRDFSRVSDCRKGDIDISMADALMSGFAMFSLKDPSLLAFDDRRGTDGNLRSIYHIENVPCDTQMRTILDEVNPEEIRPAYKNVSENYKEAKPSNPWFSFRDVTY